jgi:hypothetical protein
MGDEEKWLMGDEEKWTTHVGSHAFELAKIQKIYDLVGSK